MTIEGQISKPLAAGRMLALTGGALVVASLIVFGAILPAEFNSFTNGAFPTPRIPRNSITTSTVTP